MWPDGFDDWLDFAIGMSVAALRGRLSIYSILRPQLSGLLEQAIAVAIRVADLRRDWGDAFATQTEFARWFSETAFDESLRRAMTVAEILARLNQLPADQRRLLLWLYLDQLSFRQLAVVLNSDVAMIRRQSQQAYNDLRASIALAYGEAHDGFPLFPAAIGHGS